MLLHSAAYFLRLAPIGKQLNTRDHYGNTEEFFRDSFTTDDYPNLRLSIIHSSKIRKFSSVATTACCLLLASFSMFLRKTSRLSAVSMKVMVTHLLEVANEQYKVEGSSMEVDDILKFSIA